MVNIRLLDIQVAQMLQSRLLPDLYYHSPAHTRDVLRSALRIGREEGLSPFELELLGAAAILHDTGFTVAYADHEWHSCAIARILLPQHGADESFVERVCDLIQATRIPQHPTDLLSEILCDADLDYLGRDDFEEISNHLYRELLAYRIVNDSFEWDQIQVRFLENHHYHRPLMRELREWKKREHLEIIRERLDNRPEEEEDDE
ncbi:HD domain-containing protein [Candidatus Pollutiaquabacter sp.]|uniref:HD domain-containing protein n=1 Tax=Candidatus Pollutiaquabacter sp. TaxID=3416354 RepID=UPI003C8D7D13|nr:HD domain-containing protein [Bacteroidota bacterium]